MLPSVNTNKEKMMNRQLLSFCFVGALNTAATLLIYQLVNFIAPYWFAYSLAYVIGVLISYIGNSRIAFMVQMSTKKLTQYFAFYLLCYLCGLIITLFGVNVLSIHERIVPFLVISMMLPINFLGTRFILKMNYEN